MPSDSPLVLDTHVFVWAAEGLRISARVSKRINAAADANRLYVAAITLWEIAMGAHTGRIRIRGNVLDWIEEALPAVGVAVASTEPAIAVDSVDLPGNWAHGDPADRMIVATARHLDATLITADSAILDYASDTKAVRVLEPS
jgi:PIN domain nuclease of toxin-antitoxin system